jgi:hypothetical protein
MNKSEVMSSESEHLKPDDCKDAKSKRIFSDMTTADKIGQLTNMLNERYTAEHNMRERSTTFTLWILGIGIGLIWALLTEVELGVLQKLATCAFVLAYSLTSFYFIREISKGFKSNRTVIMKIEESLGFHHDGHYAEGDTILPFNYSLPMESKTPSSHFRTLYVLLFTSAAFLIILTIFNPVRDSNKHTLNSVTTSLQTDSIHQGGQNGRLP